MNSNKKSIITIISATLFVIIYIMYIAFPFLQNYAPANESSMTWAYNLAPLHYALILYPIVFLYMFVISKNILKIRYCRWLIYPICFCLIFVLAHMLFFIFSMVILWLCLITIPVGLILLLIIEISAIVSDIKDYKNKEAENNTKDNNIQIILNSICNIFVTIILIQGILLTFFVVNDEPKESNKQCKNFYNAIQLSNSEIDTINNLSFEKIAEYYKKDFSNIKKYENYFGSYNSSFGKGKYVESTGQADGSWINTDVNWIQFDLINKDNEKISFSFNKKGPCMKNSENCMWHMHNTKHKCSFYVNEDNSVTPIKQTAVFLKQK